MLCRTAYAGTGKFKESILEVYTQCNDDIANQVRVRAEGDNFKGFLSKKLLDSDVYLIVDRYRKYSTKKTCEASSVYQLTESASLLSQKAKGTVSSNKKWLMSIICSSIINNKESRAQHTTRNKLVITDPQGVVIVREDIATSHKEEDNTIA